MKCNYCGSEELVWDYKNGAVVCSSCGCVADSIYISQPCCTSGGNGGNSSSRVAERLYRVQRRKMVKEALRRFELEKRGFVTSGGVIHIRSLAALRSVESSPEIRERVEKGLRIVEVAKPSALCRSVRSRLALAYIVATMMEGGAVDLEELVKTFSIGKSTAYRLIGEAKQILRLGLRLFL